MPATYRNRETHWWDGSQIYGSTAERIVAGTIGPGGQYCSRRNGSILTSAGSSVSIRSTRLNSPASMATGGLGSRCLPISSTREHNAIADHLRVDYPEKHDEWIFHKARLINAALMTKIHAVEWTPAILNTPTLRFGMRGNWWGILGEHYERAYGRDKRLERLTGIPGSQASHHAAPYSITEEFVAVYRMHSLMPDTFNFRTASSDDHIETRGAR